MSKILLLLLIIIICGIIFLWTRTYYHGPKSDHFDGRFFHNIPDRSRSFFQLTTWLTTRKPVLWPVHVPITKYPKSHERSLDNEMLVTFVNHATFLIQWDGMNFLTDPIWSERASPFSWIGPKRVHEPGIAWKDLPKIDVVLISHNHYDHMDEATLKNLVERDNPIIITGLGNGEILRGFGINIGKELDWWQTEKISSEFSVTYVPAQHFSSRWPWDKNKALWGGFVLQGKTGSLYFAGDSGEGDHFQQIADRLGPFRLALLPIGAYEPRWFMQPAHLSPAETVHVHQTLKPIKSIAMHFGTFPLADEGIDQPVKELKQALKTVNVTEDDFWILEPGETKLIP